MFSLINQWTDADFVFKMDELSEMSVEKFRIWSLCALKVYLARRNKPIDGNLDELSARYVHIFCLFVYFM